MPEYAFIIYNDESQLQDPDAWRVMEEAHQAFHKAVADSGARITQMAALAPSFSGTTVASDGVVSDGPFIESKESIGGTYVIEASDLDQALALAKLCPSLGGAIEVRALMVYEPVPS